ncbi:hypothetical protein BC936DRAFT_140351 [Jimgerdemannia flammicorona]|uniref:Uncharacterized protein n=1 Tax=Jimgerdemannia flammicorona TaxID=994334 RepID=A0A433AUH2_9FUNG|nr:hypothetical protein BC936DRAFT_140351 [Jimgerdemannia flammicorona]
MSSIEVPQENSELTVPFTLFHAKKRSMAAEDPKTPKSMAVNEEGEEDDSDPDDQWESDSNPFKERSTATIESSRAYWNDLILKREARPKNFLPNNISSMDLKYPLGFETMKSYFALEKKDAPSLRDFIRLNIDFVARSSPDTNDFAALNGAWKNRFLTTAKLLGITKEIKGIRVRCRPELRLNCDHRPVRLDFCYRAANESADGLSRAVVDAIKKARHHSSGKTSPMYYGVLDLRPRSLTDYTDIRAADLLPKDHLHSVRSRLEVARSSLFDPAESVCKLLEAMQKLPAKSLVEICERMRVDGATGLLRRLVEVISVASVHRSVTLSELLKESSKGGGNTDNVPGIDAATAVGDLKSVDPEDKEIQWVFHAIDETSSLSILSTSIRIIRSGFLETTITERDIDMNLLKQFFDSLWDVTHLHYGEGESRASRNRRASIKSGGNMGDRFDWLISCYSTFPDDVRGIEFGVVENSGPNQVDGMEKVRADIVKVIKTARDQLLEIIRKVRIMYGADHLPQDIEHGIKALFIVALHVVGLNVRAYVVYWLGGNVFAVAELGSARLPHSLESIHNALKFCRLVLRTIISRSIRLVDILFTEIKLSPAGSPPKFDQWQVPDMQTPVKQRKLKLSK